MCIRDRDYMSRVLITCSPEDSILEAAKKLAENHISGMPVVKDDKVVGIISVSDIVRYMSIEIKEHHLPPKEPQSIPMVILNLLQNELRFKKELEKVSKSKVKDVMTKEVIYVEPDTSLFEAASLIQKHDITRLPVIEEGKLVGIISKSDLVKALIEF